MSFRVRQYAGEANPQADPITLTESHGSFGEAQIDCFGRAARWWDENRQTRKITAPDPVRVGCTHDHLCGCSTAICWEDGKIAFILSAESNEVAV